MGPRAGRIIRGVTGTQEGDICPPNFLKYGKAGALISAAASGAVCQWQTPSTDRSGNVDRPLSNVPPGRSGPQTPQVFEKNLTKNFYSPTARTCAGCHHRRGRSRRPIARSVQSGHGPPFTSCPARSRAWPSRYPACRGRWRLAAPPRFETPASGKIRRGGGPGSGCSESSQRCPQTGPPG